MSWKRYRESEAPLCVNAPARNGRVRAMLQTALSLIKRLRGVGERSRGELLWPDQVLLPLLPLYEYPWHLRRPVWAEAHGSRHRHHVGCRNGITDLVSL